MAVNPNLFSEEYQRIRDESFPYGTEKRFSVTDENGVTTWHRGILGLPRFVDWQVIDQLATTVTSPIVITKEVSEYAKTILEVIEQLAILIVDPVYFITNAVLNELREFVSSILNAKFSYIFTHSTVDNNKTTNQLLKDIADSVVDQLDYHRPVVDVVPLDTTIEGNPITDDYILSPSGARVFAAFVVIACPGIQSVYDLMQVFEQFISIPAFNYPDFDISIEPLVSGKRNFNRTAPDWQGYNLSDVFPVVKDVVNGINNVIDIVAAARSSVIDMIRDTIAVLEQKILQLDSIIVLLEDIIVAIIRLLEFGPLIVYTVDGTYTGPQLKAGILSGLTTSPFGTDDVGLVLGLSVTGPFIDTEQTANDVGETVDAFETNKQAIKAIFGLE